MSTNNLHLKNDPVHNLNEMISYLRINRNKPVDVVKIANQLRIIIRREPLIDGIIGGFMVKGLKRLVVIDTCIVDESLYRFILAHEIGHILMHHYEGCCTLERFDIMYDEDELEHNANLFACMLLMPKKAISKDIAKKEITFQLVEKLAVKWQVSITDMLINLAWTTLTPTIVVKIKNGVIEWNNKSDACKDAMLSSALTAKSLMETQVSQNYTAINFLEGVNPEALCRVELKYIEAEDFYLCIMRLLENK